MDTEQIVLLNNKYEPIDTAPKLASHHANTPLHLAFSVYVFNAEGKLLVTQRASTKKVWPGVWTNSCCGHPAPGESMEAAITRRLDYELGITAQDVIIALADYSYTTPPFAGIIENEFCPVYFARSNETPDPNQDEVSDYKWLSWDSFISSTKDDKKNIWSWWCKDQVKKLQYAESLLTAYTVTKNV